MEYCSLESCLLHSLVVHPDYRGKGHGKELIKAKVSQAHTSARSLIAVAKPERVKLFEECGLVRVDKAELEPEVRESWYFNIYNEMGYTECLQATKVKPGYW